MSWEVGTNSLILYTPPFQRSAWRWPNNWAETYSWNFNL